MLPEKCRKVPTKNMVRNPHPKSFSHQTKICWTGCFRIGDISLLLSNEISTFFCFVCHAKPSSQWTRTKDNRLICLVGIAYYYNDYLTRRIRILELRETFCGFSEMPNQRSKKVCPSVYPQITSIQANLTLMGIFSSVLITNSSLSSKRSEIGWVNPEIWPNKCFLGGLAKVYRIYSQRYIASTKLINGANWITVSEVREHRVSLSQATQPLSEGKDFYRYLE